jgi:hypothetical protein
MTGTTIAAMGVLVFVEVFAADDADDAEGVDVTKTVVGRCVLTVASCWTKRS